VCREVRAGCSILPFLPGLRLTSVTGNASGALCHSIMDDGEILVALAGLQVMAVVQLSRLDLIVQVKSVHKFQASLDFCWILSLQVVLALLAEVAPREISALQALHRLKLRTP